MMRKTLLLFLVSVALNSVLLSQVSYRSKVSSLNTDYAKTFFLKSIFQADQDIRKYEDSVMVATGWKSPEHLAAIDSLLYIEKILTDQMAEYLDHYDYPSHEKFDETARIAPWAVMHHSTNEEKRIEHFPKLYNAYKNGNLEGRRLLSFLEREYHNRFKQAYQSYGKEEEQIEELIKKLELMPIRNSFKLPFSK